MSILDKVNCDRALAKKATQGPWDSSIEFMGSAAMVLQMEAGVGILVGYTSGGRSNLPDAEHIAQHDPPTVLDQCDAIEDMVQVLERITGDGVCYRDEPTDRGKCTSCIANACLRRHGIGTG